MRFWSWGLLGMSKTALSIGHRDGAHELVDLDVNDVLGALNRRRDPQQPSRGDHQDASGHKGPNSAKQSEHDASLGLVRTPINTGLQSNCTSAQRMALVQFDLGLWVFGKRGFTRPMACGRRGVRATLSSQVKIGVAVWAGINAIR
jgi:hypothetical protein